MLEKLFHPGQRKIMAFIIGVALTLFGDKVGITMTEENQTAILALVGIFTGGNVLSKFAHALIKGAPLVSQSLPPDPVAMPEAEQDLVLGEIVRVENYAKQIAKDATAELNKVHKRCKTIEDNVIKTSQSVNELIAMMNATRPAAPTQQRPPTPNELYQG